MIDLKGKGDKSYAEWAVREKSPEIIELGLMSFFQSNAVEDYRDVIVGLCIYYDALSRIGCDADEYLKGFIDEHPEYALHIEPFLLREDKTIKAAGIKVIEHPEFRYVDDW